MSIIATLRRGKTSGAVIAALMLVAITLVPTLGTLPPVAQTAENLRYAAIVVDATTGEVLFARRADSQRYPASITKVMTLYLAFEALSEGRIKLDDVLTVSPRAASQPPSKLGLAAGQTITLDDAMHATAVRSANDMAVLVAEHIGGSEARFAAMATLKAQELGMSQTRYVNANGLPDSRQVTSARDLAILARAVMRDYPQYYRFFGTHDWQYQGREYRNTNGLLHSGNGYDGIKTGFTNASGYNLAASAVRDGKRLITIVLGGRTTASRNQHVAGLMDTGFEVERLRARGQTIQVAQTYFESHGYGIGPETTGPVVYAANEDDGEGIGSSAAGTGVPYAIAAATPPAPVPARVPVATPPTRLPAPAPTVRASTSGGDLTASLNGAPNTPRRPAATAPAPRTTARAAVGRWAVQVGAFRDEAVALDWLTEVNRRFRTEFANTERAVQDAAGWYRARFTGLTEDRAQAACAALAERRVTCMVVRPE